MKHLIMLLLVALTCAAVADDITLKNGDIYQNVQILKTESGKVHLKSTTGEFAITASRIKKIDQKPFNSNTPSQTIIGSAAKHGALKHGAQNAQYTYPNGKLWPISALAAVVAWDAFAEAGDLQNAIDAFEGYDDDYVSKLESAKTRKAIIGGVALAAGVLNGIIAFQKVELTANDGMVGLAYHF